MADGLPARSGALGARGCPECDQRHTATEGVDVAETGAADFGHALA